MSLCSCYNSSTHHKEEDIHKHKWRRFNVLKQIQGHKPSGCARTHGTENVSTNNPIHLDANAQQRNHECRTFLPEENYVGSDAEHHSDDAVAHQVEVPPPLPLPLLCRHLLCMRLTKLLPVANALLGIHTDDNVLQ